jgi:nitrogen fixation/metabolism regulation signal transduction histidine kinase
MAKKGTIVLFAACCILVSVPVSYLVNTYRMANSIAPTAVLIFVKYLPFLVLSAILVYGVYEVFRLADLNRTRDAAKLSVSLIILLAVASAVWMFTFNLGVRYIL